MHYTSRNVYEYISQQNDDLIIERRTCIKSGRQFPIFQSEHNLLEKISPIYGPERYIIPHATLAPEERMRRRMTFRNERTLYKRTCDHSGKSIVSIYPAESNYTVYDQDVWRSDEHDPLQYGQPIDFSKPVFEQYNQLLIACPKASIQNSDSENSAYTNYSWGNKDCYLCEGSGGCEGCLYCYRTTDSTYIVDCFNTHNSNQCYQCNSCINCSNCFFCEDMKDCQFCFACNDQQGKEYMIGNKQVTKEQYTSYMSTLNHTKTKLLHAHGLKKQIYTNTIINTQNCTGNDLQNCKSCQLSYVWKSSEDCLYSQFGTQNTSCLDTNFADENQLQYDATNLHQNYQVAFAALVWFCKRSYYLTFSFHSQDCFLCTGLKKQQYCIFNKQYTKHEYETLVPKLITHMQETGERGEFFPGSISPFAYNETIAHEHYPFTKEKAINAGYKRQDNEYPINVPAGTSTIQAKEIPDSLKEVDESIISKAIICEDSGKPFRILKQEITFYRKHNLPIPHKHPSIRHQLRGKKRPARSLHLRTCDKIGEQMLSVYPQDAPFRVYSEEAYRKDMFG